MVERWMFKEEDLKVQALYCFEAQIPSQSTSATDRTD